LHTVCAGEDIRRREKGYKRSGSASAGSVSKRWIWLTLTADGTVVNIQACESSYEHRDLCRGVGFHGFMIAFDGQQRSSCDADGW
jgi:hypothetical protein